jgi:uncharacterized membrane-anchored protein YhcB (DUF1043 family)
MFGEVSLWTWMGGAIVFAIGGAAGFFIARQIKDERTRQLEQQLESARNEMTSYRGEVNQHFLKTSLLVSKLTDNYREVYEHLATGAQKLCKERPPTPELKLPETTILPASAALAADVPAPVAEEPQDEPMEMHAGADAAPSHATSDDSMATGDTSTEQAAVATTGQVEGAAGTEETTRQQTAEEKQAASINEEQAAPTANETPEADEEEAHLGVESAPSVDLKHHTHPSIH